MNFGLDIVDGVRGLHLQGDGFTRKAAMKINKRIELEDKNHIRLDENLHVCGRFDLSNDVNDGVFDKSKSRICDKEQECTIAKVL